MALQVSASILAAGELERALASDVPRTVDSDMSALLLGAGLSVGLR